MAKKYTNFRIGGSPQKVTDDYTVWSNDLLQGEPGDYLVQYGPGDYGVVGREIFGKTYETPT